MPFECYNPAMSLLLTLNKSQWPNPCYLWPFAQLERSTKLRPCSYNEALLLSLAHKTQLTNLCSASLCRAESVTLPQVMLSKTKALNKKPPLCDDLLTRNFWHIIRSWDSLKNLAQLVSFWFATEERSRKKTKGNGDHGSGWRSQILFSFKPQGCSFLILSHIKTLRSNMGLG